jgi:methionyl aminopeptidase
MNEEHVKPSFLGYLDYPAVVCTSINDEAVHGVPSSRELQEGDLLKLDMGVIHEGLHTDMATTLLVSGAGAITKRFSKRFAHHRRLMRATQLALDAAIKVARPGNMVYHIGEAAEKVLQKHDCTVLKELGGHGIGRELHEEPFVPNWNDRDATAPLVPGMTIALEPIASIGTEWRIKDGKDGFVHTTKDGSLAAHFEHTIAITDNKPLVLTME